MSRSAPQPRTMITPMARAEARRSVPNCCTRPVRITAAYAHFTAQASSIYTHLRGTKVRNGLKMREITAKVGDQGSDKQ